MHLKVPYTGPLMDSGFNVISIYSSALPTKKILDFFETKKTVFLEDHEADHLFKVVMKGL